VGSYKIEVPPAEAWWCRCECQVGSYKIEVPPVKAWWCHPKNKRRWEASAPLK